MQAPLLEILSLILILGLAVLQGFEGAFRAWTLLVNVFVAGLVAFDWFEVFARAVGESSPVLDPYADALVLTVLFCLILVLLRCLTVSLAPSEPVLPRVVRSGVGAACGAVTGYLVSGLLLCIVQTLPLPQRFLGYDPSRGMGLGSPERVWLSAMHRASGVVFDWPRGQTRWFDADGSFIPRYTRYRRLPESGLPERNRGEFPRILPATPPDDADAGQP